MPARVRRILLNGGLALFVCSQASVSRASERRAPIPRDFVTTREASNPQISPDGQTIVFVLEEPGPQPAGQPWRGDQDLWRMPADGSAPPQRWISSPERDWSPQWSPNGDRLAFLSNRNSGGTKTTEAQIYIANADASQLRQLTQLTGGVSNFRWSPDGNSIAFLHTKDVADDAAEPRLSNRPQPLTTLYRISISDLSSTVISPPGLHVIDFDWSPDGSKIAAITSPTAKTADVVNARQLVILNPTKLKVERRFSNRIGWNSQVLWSPDSQFIHVDLWSESPGDAWLPALVSPTNGQIRVLLKGVRATLFDPRWSADSRFLMGQLLEENQNHVENQWRSCGCITR